MLVADTNSVVAHDDHLEPISDGLVLGTVARYALHGRIASGGMATVHLGRLIAPGGFSRIVAVKRLRRRYATDPAFVKMFVDEARTAGRIQHANVVPTLDVLALEGELLLVMDYVRGESVRKLWTGADGKIPLPIAVAIASEMLHGLHAAHETKSEAGVPLGIVHRDVSPQNVIVGVDGVTRVFDFGIVHAETRVQSATEFGVVKGKLAYMTPEQLKHEPVTRATDIFAAGIVLWELLTGRRLFACPTEEATSEKILIGWVEPPSSINPAISAELDEVVLKALAARPKARYATAREMAIALEDASPRALNREVGSWVEVHAERSLAEQDELAKGVAQLVEADTRVQPISPRVGPSTPRTGPPPPPPPPSSELTDEQREILENATTIALRGDATERLPKVAKAAQEQQQQQQRRRSAEPAPALEIRAPRRTARRVEGRTLAILSVGLCAIASLVLVMALAAWNRKNDEATTMPLGAADPLSSNANAKTTTSPSSAATAAVSSHAAGGTAHSEGIPSTGGGKTSNTHRRSPINNNNNNNNNKSPSPSPPAVKTHPNSNSSPSSGAPLGDKVDNPF